MNAKTKKKQMYFLTTGLVTLHNRFNHLDPLDLLDQGNRVFLVFLLLQLHHLILAGLDCHQDQEDPCLDLLHPGGLLVLAGHLVHLVYHPLLGNPSYQLDPLDLVVQVDLLDLEDPVDLLGLVHLVHLADLVYLVDLAGQGNLEVLPDLVVQVDLPLSLQALVVLACQVHQAYQAVLVHLAVLMVLLDLVLHLGLKVLVHLWHLVYQCDL